MVDVVVIGAGPAGGQCARDLAKAGKTVLIVERSRDFSVNNYSSGGAPSSIMDEFDLPTSIVSTLWSQLSLSSAHYSQKWHSPSPLGVVLDFGELRAFLAKDAARHGARLLLHTSYLSHRPTNDGHYIVTLRCLKSRSVHEYRAKLLVDATGSERQVLAGKSYDTTTAIQGTGIEYLIRVPSSLYDRYRETLSFYVGIKWMPQGYGWIFPATASYLKIGVIRCLADRNVIPSEKSYQHYLNKLMAANLDGMDATTATIVDKHGKTIYYTPSHGDKLYHSSILAVGDAISTVNPLAYEGIRHAMFSGRAAAQTISLLEQGTSLTSYETAMRRYRSFKWKLAEKIMQKVFTLPREEDYDLLVRTFRDFTAEEIVEFGFDYKLTKIVKCYWRYLRLLFKLP